MLAGLATSTARFNLVITIIELRSKPNQPLSSVFFPLFARNLHGMASFFGTDKKKRKKERRNETEQNIPGVSFASKDDSFFFTLRKEA